MQDDPRHERVRISIAERGQMASAVCRRGRVGLDLQADQPATGQLGEEVHFEPALLLAHVMETRTRWRDRELGAELGGDERVEESAKQVAVAHHEIDVDAEHRGGETRIDT